MENDSYMTIKDAGEYLGISSATVRNWIKTSKINASSIDGKLLISADEIRSLHNSLDTAQILKSRRNKSRINENFIPKNYIDSKSPNFNIIMSLLKEASACSDSSFDPVYYCASAMMKNRKIPDEIIAELLPAHIISSSKIKALPINYIEGEDALGMLYISLQSIRSKKSKGAYYTPYFAVDLIVSKLSVGHKTVCDPSCGTGNFLLRLSNEIPLDHIYGSDIDPIAVSIARINLAIKYRITTKDELNTLKHNIIVSNFLTDKKHFACDLYLGNPPWGYIFSSTEKSNICSRYFNSGRNSRPESFDLFVEKAIDSVKDYGTISFLLPEAILGANIHEWIREYISEKSCVQSIKYLGDIFDKVQCPCIILTLCKGSDSIGIIDVSFYKKKSKLELAKQFQVPADRITNANFNILIDNDDYQTICKIKNCPHFTLKGHADFALGIVTGSNNTLLKDKQEPGYEKILKGKEIQKYYYNDPSSFIKFDPANLQQVAPEHLYRAKEKLFYKFIANEPVFAYDDTGMLSLNSANIMIPRVTNYSIPYIMAILNSPVISYYYKNTYRSVKVLRSAIEELPIAICDSETMHRISSLSLELARNKTDNADSTYELNDMILSLYDICADELT